MMKDMNKPEAAVSNTSNLGLRDAHKNRTRRALRQAALELFAARGFDTTTAGEVAEKAGVSVRTFFRYFPTKESVLFLGQRSWGESFGEWFHKQPDSLSDVDAMCAALVELASDLPQSRKSLVMYERVLTTSVTLRGYEQDQQEESATQIAEAIAKRRGLAKADDACRLLAAVGVALYRLSLDSWLSGPASVPLRKIIVEKFACLSGQFAEAQNSTNTDVGSG